MLKGFRFGVGRARMAATGAKSLLFGGHSAPSGYASDTYSKNPDSGPTAGPAAKQFRAAADGVLDMVERLVEALRIHQGANLTEVSRHCRF